MALLSMRSNQQRLCNAAAELLVQGLTFDCVGLAPGDSAASPEQGALLGLKQFPAGEALSLQPGPHIAAGAALLPVTQALLGLGAALARLPGVLAVCWHPAQAWMEPDYFQTIASDWIKGGAFPALGLATLHPLPDGGFRSHGLAFFIGQELRLEARLNLSPAADGAAGDPADRPAGASMAAWPSRAPSRWRGCRRCWWCQSTGVRRWCIRPQPADRDQ